MKRTVGLAYVAAAALSIIAVQGGPAHAVPLGLATGLPAAADEVSPVEKTQFIFGGREYCFYLDGWRGPGWYWCGYAFRRGLGWGGPTGWHGWRHGGPGPGRPHIGGPGPRPHIGGPGPRPGRGPGGGGRGPGGGGHPHHH